jgi:hypothetical protein
MTTIVKMTNSAYYPCLKNIYANVVSGRHLTVNCVTKDYNVNFIF